MFNLRLEKITGDLLISWFLCLLRDSRIYLSSRIIGSYYRKCSWSTSRATTYATIHLNIKNSIFHTRSKIPRILQTVLNPFCIRLRRSLFTCVEYTIDWKWLQKQKLNEFRSWRPSTSAYPSLREEAEYSEATAKAKQEENSQTFSLIIYT